MPEAEPLVADLRSVHDHMAARGVPAHVTVLHPFRPTLDDDAVSTIASVCAAVPSFAATLASVRRFDDTIVVYLVPSPAAPFVELTRLLVAAFPDCPPYGGAHPDTIPHLTVASRATPSTADALGPVLAAGLPITVAVTHLTRLVEDDAGLWTIDRSWPLA